MAYGTLTAWRTYASARGNTEPANTPDVDANAALERASDYVRTRYVLRFASGYDETAEGVDEATYIAASLELATPGFFATTFTPGQAKVLTKVADIQWTPLERSGSMPKGADALRPVVPSIEALLARYVGGYVSAIQVV